jgi:hypothetical protein
LLQRSLSKREICTVLNTVVANSSVPWISFTVDKLDELSQISVRHFAIDAHYGIVDSCPQWVLYASLASVVLADGLISVPLCVLLERRRTGFKTFVPPT